MKQYKNHLVIQLPDGTTISVRRLNKGFQWYEGSTHCWSSHLGGVKDSAEAMGGKVVRIPNPNYTQPVKRNTPEHLMSLLGMFR